MFAMCSKRKLPVRLGLNARCSLHLCAFVLCISISVAHAVRVTTSRTSQQSPSTATPPTGPATAASGGQQSSKAPTAAAKSIGKGVRPLLALGIGRPKITTPPAAGNTPTPLADPLTSVPPVAFNTNPSTTAAVAAAAAATTAAATNASAPSTPGPCGLQRTRLGYQCNFTTPEGLTIHWSNGTALPINPCTINTTGTQETANMPPRKFIHFAVEGDVPVGRIEVGFPDEPGATHPSEVVYGAVIGNVTSRAQVGQAFTMFRRNTRETSFSSSWAAYKRVYRPPAPEHQRLLLCFSRLRTNMHMNTGGDVSRDFKLTWAIYTQPEPFSLDSQAPTRFGGAVVDVSNGAVRYVASNKSRVLALHGVLMLLAFGLLLPMGTLASRHKWMFKGMEDNGVPIWLLAHLGLQLLGVVLGLGGIVLVLATFGNTDPGSSWWRTHQALGIVILVVSLLQVPLGMMRPDNSTSLHRTWYKLHSTAGKANAAAGIINMLIGTVVMHQIQAAQLWLWLVPAMLCCGVVLVAAVAMEVKMVDLERDGLFKPSHKLYKSGKMRDPFLAPLKGNIGKSGSGAFDGATPRHGDGYTTTPLASMGSMDFRRRRSTASGTGSWSGQAAGGVGGGVHTPSHLRRGDTQQVAINYV